MSNNHAKHSTDSAFDEVLEREISEESESMLRRHQSALENKMQEVWSVMNENDMGRLRTVVTNFQRWLETEMCYQEPENDGRVDALRSLITKKTAQSIESTRAEVREYMNSVLENLINSIDTIASVKDKIKYSDLKDGKYKALPSKKASKRT